MPRPFAFPEHTRLTPTKSDAETLAGSEVKAEPRRCRICDKPIAPLFLNPTDKCLG